MERDFMGLNCKDSVVVVKEEAAEGFKDSAAFFKSPQVQWQLPNTLNPTNKFQSVENQENFNQNREGGTHFSMTNYPIQKNAHNQKGNPLSMSNSFFKPQFTGAGQNSAAASPKPHYLGGIPITAPHSYPSISSVAGTTEPWFSQKTSRTPAQMTIFYNGTVNVFDDISPEKLWGHLIQTQAIMFLAGNGSSGAYNVAQPRHQVQAPSPKPVAEDVAFGSQPLNTPPCSAISSPISVSSHPVRQSSTNSDGPTKTTGGLTTPVNNGEVPKAVTSNGHVAGTTMIQSAVPQARKASLARFLEKRKERVMSSAPYNNLSKKTGDCATPGSNDVAFSGTSDLGSASISTGKDSSH